MFLFFSVCYIQQHRSSEMNKRVGMWQPTHIKQLALAEEWRSCIGSPRQDWDVEGVFRRTLSRP